MGKLNPCIKCGSAEAKVAECGGGYAPESRVECPCGVQGYPGSTAAGAVAIWNRLNPLPSTPPAPAGEAAAAPAPTPAMPVPNPCVRCGSKEAKLHVVHHPTVVPLFTVRCSCGQWYGPTLNSDLAIMGWNDRNPLPIPAYTPPAPTPEPAPTLPAINPCGTCKRVGAKVVVYATTSDGSMWRVECPCGAAGCSSSFGADGAIYAWNVSNPTSIDLPPAPAPEPSPAAPVAGLSRRDFFAAAVMQGMVSNPNMDVLSPEDLADRAATRVDALIARLSRGEGRQS
jgi:hypothetical protein